MQNNQVSTNSHVDELEDDCIGQADSVRVTNFDGYLVTLFGRICD